MLMRHFPSCALTPRELTESQGPPTRKHHGGGLAHVTRKHHGGLTHVWPPGPEDALRWDMGASRGVAPGQSDV